MLSRLIFLIMFVLMGLVTALWTREAWLASGSNRWPTTQGTVVAFYETPNFSYAVNGSVYTNSQASCNEFCNSYVAIRNSSKYAIKYPLNSAVTVHYRPSEPSRAVLETKFDPSIVIAIAGMLLMTTLCGAGTILGWRFGRTHLLNPGC